MRMIVAAVIAGFVAFAIPDARAAEALVHSTAYGFSVAMPAFPKQNDAGISVTPVTFSGPLRDGKAPTCNVQIQNMGQTLTEFRTQSLGQFKAIGLTLDAETHRKVSGRDALLLTSSGHDLKILSLAVPVGHSIYLLTCLAPVDQFAAYEKVFQGVIDSFALD